MKKFPEKIENEVMSAVKQVFAPEFLNRLDEIIIFDQLTEEDLFQIIDLQVRRLNEMLANRALEVRLLLIKPRNGLLIRLVLIGNWCKTFEACFAEIHRRRAFEARRAAK